VRDGLGEVEQGEEGWDKELVKHFEVYGYSGSRWPGCLMISWEMDRLVSSGRAASSISLHCGERNSLLAQACQCNPRETDAPPPCGSAELLLVPRGSVGTLSGGSLEIDRCSWIGTTLVTVSQLLVHTLLRSTICLL
jgi:hypothetical protein